MLFYEKDIVKKEIFTRRVLYKSCFFTRRLSIKIYTLREWSRVHFSQKQIQIRYSPFPDPRRVHLFPWWGGVGVPLSCWGGGGYPSPSKRDQGPESGVPPPPRRALGSETRVPPLRRDMGPETGVSQKSPGTRDRGTPRGRTDQKGPLTPNVSINAVSTLQ